MFKLSIDKALKPVFNLNYQRLLFRTIKSDARSDEYFQTVLSLISDKDYKQVEFWKECDKTINNLPISERFKHVWPNALLRHYAHKTGLKQNEYELGLSLFDYIKSEKLDERNKLTVLSAALRLCGERGSSEIDRINYLIDEIYKIADLFDVDTCQSIIVGLSATSRWKDSYKYLDMAKLTSNTLGPEFYAPLIKAALKHEDKKEIDKLTKMLHENDVYVSEKIVDYFIQKGKNWLLSLLFYYYEYRWIPGANQAEMIKEAFLRF